MSVSRRLRYEILRRDDYACRYCGGRAPDVQLTVDHILPVALGGSDEADNLVAACAACNAGKSSVNPDQPLVEQVSADALRWASLQGDARYLLQSYRDQFAQRWAQWHYGDNESPLPLPDNWPDSLEQFFRAGLEIEAVLDLIDVAGRSRAPVDRTFRYFCGCCWRRLTERQQIARDLLVREEANSF